jgi:hypothetical protein
MLIALLALSLAAFGTWGVMRRWRLLAETQLRLDRCMAPVALQLRDTLTMIESANKQIRYLRDSIFAAEETGQAEFIPPLEVALDVEVARQEVGRARWLVKEGTWLVRQGCGGGDRAPALPTLGYRRGIPDSAGPQELEWYGQPREFRIQLNHSPRAAAAVISRSSERDQEAESHGLFASDASWSARWSAPESAVTRLARRAGFH